MSKPLSPQDVLAQGGSVAVEETVDDQLKRLQLKQLTKQVQEQEEAENTQKAAQKANALSLEKGRLDQEFYQDQCPHLKPNGQTALAGQYDHAHHPIIICQYCQKDFQGKIVPPHLRISPDRLGGPQ